MIKIACDKIGCRAGAIVGWEPLLTEGDSASVVVDLPEGWSVASGDIDGTDAIHCPVHS